MVDGSFFVVHFAKKKAVFAKNSCAKSTNFIKYKCDNTIFGNDSEQIGAVKVLNRYVFK